MKIKNISENDVSFTIEIKPEITSPVSCFFTESGLPDREIEKYIISEIKKGNTWAWCKVTVKAKWKNFSGIAVLGGMSYESEKEFKNDSYFDQLKSEALENLNSKIKTSALNIIPLIL